MKIIPLENIINFSLPLPIYSSVHLADAIGKDGEEFGIFVGMEKRYVEQLREYSLNKKDADLQENTSDTKRFGKGIYEDWYGKNRTPFVLIHKRTDILAALVWLGPEPLYEDESTWNTIGWRSYGTFRGKGLMKIFTQFAIDTYITKVPNMKIWGAIRKGNKGSERLARELGFEEATDESDDDSLIMIKL